MECSTSEYGCGYGEGEGLHFQYLCPGIQVVKLNMLTLYHFFFRRPLMTHTHPRDAMPCHSTSFHVIFYITLYRIWFHRVQWPHILPTFYSCCFYAFFLVIMMYENYINACFHRLQNISFECLN